jgi:riboflavin kinase/FMN adenylyltransferase
VQTLHGIDGLRQTPHGAAMTIGNFDGIHLGHRHILQTCCARREQGASAVVVVTFEPHPFTVLRPKAVAPRLTTPAMKQELIAGVGADFYVILPPEPGVLNLTAEDFWGILRDDVRPSHLIEGADFTFGKNRGGDVGKLAEWSAGSAVQFELTEPMTAALLDLKLVRVSSSLIRWLLAHGRVRDAAICLGRPYILRGEVVQGFQRGRTIGVPTANLRCTDQLIPADGVYAGRCRVDGVSYPAAVSIGDMPTFKENVHQIEAHLLGFEGDIYGRTLDLELIDWLRDQVKYSSMEALKEQIGRDVAATRGRGEMDPSLPLVG